MEENDTGQSHCTAGSEDYKEIDNFQSKEINKETEILDNESIRLAKERAENSNKLSKALIVFGFESWIALEPSIL